MFSLFSCCQASVDVGEEVEVEEVGSRAVIATPEEEKAQLREKEAPRVSANQLQGETLPMTFTCTLQRETKLGMVCAIYHNSLEIVKIGEDGDAQKYNCSAPESERLLVGDHIVAVNGESDSEKMFSSMQEGTVLLAEIVRPRRFNAKVARHPESSVGMKIVYTSTTAGISIKSLSAGCVEGYNESAPEGSKVKAGDLVVDLNGVGANGKKMAAVMKDAAYQELDFSVLRLER